MTGRHWSELDGLVLRWGLWSKTTDSQKGSKGIPGSVQGDPLRAMEYPLIFLKKNLMYILCASYRILSMINSNVSMKFVIR